VDVLAPGEEGALHRVEPCSELVAGGPKRGLRLDAELAREIRDREQQIAKLLRSSGGALEERLAELADFLLDLRHHLTGLRPVESDAGDARADLVRAQQGGERSRHAGKDAGRCARVGLLTRLHPRPLFDDRVGRVEAAASSCGGRKRASRRREHVRMTPDELVVDGAHRISHLEPSGFGGDLRLEHALEEHVAQFAPEAGEIAAVDRVERFVRLLQQERTERLWCLLSVPGAPLRRSQRVHEPDEARECRAGSPGAPRDGGRSRNTS